MGPTLAVPGKTKMEVENGDEEASTESDEDEMAPVIRLQTQRQRHPFVKLLLALWPFGDSFKELGLLGKMYEICKVWWGREGTGGVRSYELGLLGKV